MITDIAEEDIAEAKITARGLANSKSWLLTCIWEHHPEIYPILERFDSCADIISWCLEHRFYVDNDYDGEGFDLSITNRNMVNFASVTVPITEDRFVALNILSGDTRVF